MGKSNIWCPEHCWQTLLFRVCYFTLTYWDDNIETKIAGSDLGSWIWSNSLNTITRDIAVSWHFTLLLLYIHKVYIYVNVHLLLVALNIYRGRFSVLSFLYSLITVYKPLISGIYALGFEFFPPILLMFDHVYVRLDNFITEPRLRS